MACVFCRGMSHVISIHIRFPAIVFNCSYVDSLGRKLKCDGRPTCANCHKRGLLCSYVPV